MAGYGPPESNRTEVYGLTLFLTGLTIWVAALAYAAVTLQVILVVVGLVLDALGLFTLYRAKVAGDAARAAMKP